MRIQFVDQGLRDLCCSHDALRAKYDDYATVIQRRLLVLSSAEMLAQVTTDPPDRRRREKAMGSRTFSVCARAAGRIYFEALSESDDDDFNGATLIKIISIGGRT